jgi:hypothetical protein
MQQGQCIGKQGRILARNGDLDLRQHVAQNTHRFRQPIHLLSGQEAEGENGHSHQAASGHAQSVPDMVARIVEVVPASEGTFRNILPKFVEDALKQHQADMFLRQI